MLISLFQGNLSFESAIAGILACLVIIFLVLPFHEWAHGFVANLFGDKTAKYSGRLSLNPLSHIDPFGAACIFLFGFGWAKPVPVNPNNFKNPKLGMAITAAAGPFSNFLAAIVGGVFINLLDLFGPSTWQLAVYTKTGMIHYIYIFLVYFVIINISLAAFNILPIPPLDGSKVLFVCLPARITNIIYQYEQFFIPIIYILMFAGVLSGPLKFIQLFLLKAVLWAAGLPFIPFK